MTSISDRASDFNSCPPHISQITDYLSAKLEKYQLVFLLVDDDGGDVSFCPSSVRCNQAYAWRRQFRYDEYQRAFTHLCNIDQHRCLSNAFMITLTYGVPQVNPPSSVISEFRRALRKRGVREALIVAEAHASGYIHHHAIVITSVPYQYYGCWDKKTGRRLYRSNAMRALVRSVWTHGHVDVQAITDPDGAGNYVMKELVKQAHCEFALKRYREADGDEGALRSSDIKQLRTLYFAKRYRRRLVSVSPRLSKLGAELLEAEGGGEVEGGVALIPLNSLK